MFRRSALRVGDLPVASDDPGDPTAGGIAVVPSLVVVGVSCALTLSAIGVGAALWFDRLAGPAPRPATGNGVTDPVSPVRTPAVFPPGLDVPYRAAAPTLIDAALPPAYGIRLDAARAAPVVGEADRPAPDLVWADIARADIARADVGRSTDRATPAGAQAVPLPERIAVAALPPLETVPLVPPTVVAARTAAPRRLAVVQVRRPAAPRPVRDGDAAEQTASIVGRVRIAHPRIDTPAVVRASVRRTPAPAVPAEPAAAWRLPAALAPTP